MTEPSPSPIPTTSSSQSWLDSLDPLNHLWKEQPFVAYVITALALPLAIWLGKRAWKTWERRQRTQRITARKQQLPPVRLPFTVEVGYQRLTLEPAQPQQNFAPEGMSIVRLLSAKSTPVPFLDRAEALTRLETWARSEERFAIHVLGGDGGSGKTRLGVELCRRLTTPSTHHQGAEVWQAGFLQNIERSDNTSSSNDASSLLLVIDYAEARPEVVTEVINVALQAAEDPERRRVRIVFLVRRPSPLSVTHQSSNKWLDALRPQKSQNEGVNLILDEASTIILSDEGLSDREREELFEAAYRSFTEPSESSPASDIIEQLNDPMYSQPLLVTVDAFLNARPQSRTQQSCSPSELFEEVLCHEEHYWAEHWPSSLAVNADRHHQTEGTATPTDTQGNLNRKLARQAVAAATLTDIQDEEDAISLLNLLPANPGKNTKDLARWLRNCYPPHMNANGQPALWCEHLEPDRIGEHLVASTADDLVPLLRELLSPSRAGTSSLRTWTALERASTDPRLNEQVGRIINDVLVEVTQAVHAQTVNSQSPDLAAGFAKLVNAVRPHIDPNKAHEAQQTLSDSGYFTALLEYELAQCSANILPPTDDSSEIDRATYASRRLSLSRCLANIGRHDEALKAVREATKLYRTLAEHNPGTYTPNLASSLNNLAGSQAENGQPHDALQTVHEATNLYRTLAKHNPAAYTPDLARSLNNLAIYLDGNGQPHKALQTAQEATNLYRTLAKHNPAAYTPDLAMCLINLAIRLADNGQHHEALQTAQEATNLYRTLAKHNPAAYTPNLAMCLINLAIHLDGNGQPHKALQTAQEATNLYRTLAKHNPAAYTPNLAKSLNNLAIHLDGNGQPHKALQTAQEAVTIRRKLAKHNPAAYTPTSPCPSTTSPTA
ncbi:tetratricopeptide repeat protein [Actinomyces sp. oral taxon 175]|uniref:tetratricopeptide repeat protein n=1 Tax=Actinomyces sp. oral taxon 175 TaxID=712119 RepID=UPI00021D4263|nr:tetratricopeptide repeat protein [Actinomyces sp. oral taxon 175]EGV13942.1 tetratricopeptide repeat protein [Actinomyces sp. oral taxon 175 str. F0384]